MIKMTKKNGRKEKTNGKMKKTVTALFTYQFTIKAKKKFQQILL